MNHSGPAPQIVFVDVDDTLVTTTGTKQIPIPSVIARVRQLSASGAELYCWSTGGAAYAKEVASRLGIDKCFAAFLPKPHLIIDDQPVADWRECRHLYPLQC